MTSLQLVLVVLQEVVHGGVVENQVTLNTSKNNKDSNLKTMKNAVLLLMAGILAGCSYDESLDEISNVREIKATLNGFKSEETSTRTDYNISEVSGFETVWSVGDVLGIYPIGGDQVAFPISDGAGTTTAKFDGGSWALRSEYKYAAYYPFSKDCYTIDQKQIPVSYEGQIQTGDNSTKHLTAFDFMAAAGTQPSSDGSVNLQFEHIGCFLRMQFTMPKPATLTEVQITVSGGGSFITNGKVNLAAPTPALNSTGYTSSSTVTLKLRDVETTIDNQTITLYMMVAPRNLSSKTLTFSVKDFDENIYTQTAEGKNMIATYAYNYSLSFEDPTHGDLDYADASNPFNDHDYVDLGQKDEQGRTIFWATCNLGAQYTTDNGSYFAWGEINGFSNDIADGREFNWNDYKFMKEGFTSASGLIKYTSTDNKLVLEPVDDAARRNWGGLWRMPTEAEFEFLRDHCTSENISVRDARTNKYIEIKKYTSNVAGYTDKYIYLPYAGNRGLGKISDEGTEGYYWSSTLLSSDSRYARYIMISTSSSGTNKFEAPRYNGFSIRPVCVLEQ